MNDMVQEARKPGRPARQRDAAGLSVDEAHRDGIVMGDTRDPNTEAVQQRVRIPVNAGQNLAMRGYVMDWDNYHYKWVHESPTRPGKLEAHKAAFYEHCQLNGSNIVTPSGGGADYLMRLPKKYWLEDVAASRKKREDMRRRDNKLGQGEYTVDDNGKPREGGEINVRRSHSDNPYSG